MLRFVLLASLLLLEVTVGTVGSWITHAGAPATTESIPEEAGGDEGRAANIPAGPLNTQNYSLAFNGHSDEYVEVAVGLDTSLQQWFSHRHEWVAVAVWIKPEQNLTGRNVILEFTIKSHYVLFIEQNSLMLAETGGEGGEAERGWSIYSYNLDLTSPEWIYVLVVAQVRPHWMDGILFQDPSVFVKGLVKSTTPQKLEHTIIENKQMMEGYQKTDKLVIGRGFRGSITLLTIYKWEQVEKLYHHEIWECMAFHGPPQCVISDKHFVKDFTYKISGSSIRWETNAIRPFFHSNIECKNFEVNLDINPAGFDLATPQQTSERYYKYSYYEGGHYVYRNVTTYPVDVTLGEPGKGCKLSWDENTEMYTIRHSPLLDCGFTSSTLGNETLYHNTVYQHTDSTRKKLMDISCKYEPRPVLREEITIAAYAVEDVSFTVNHTYTPLKMSLELFSDRFYSRQLQNPTKLGDVDQVIYVEAGVHANSDVDLKVELEVESCRTHVTLNEHDTLQTKLIENFQPTNPSVTFIHSAERERWDREGGDESEERWEGDDESEERERWEGDDESEERERPTRKRFSFKAAQFKEYPNAMVYLSCVLSAKELEETTEKGGGEGEEERRRDDPFEDGDW